MCVFHSFYSYRIVFSFCFVLFCVILAFCANILSHRRQFIQMSILSVSSSGINRAHTQKKSLWLDHCDKTRILPTLHISHPALTRSLGCCRWKRCYFSLKYSFFVCPCVCLSLSLRQSNKKYTHMQKCINGVDGFQ